MQQSDIVEGERHEPFAISEHPRALRQIAYGLREQVGRMMQGADAQAAFTEWKKRQMEEGNPYGIAP